jgi:hypothetical protein
MTPLEAARKILDEGPLLGQTSDDYRSWYTCVFCVAEQEWADDFPHKPDCPWLAMPKIVAALEAAEAVLHNEMGSPEQDDGTCWFCMQGSPQMRDLSRANHADGCEWKALKVSMKGEPA